MFGMGFVKPGLMSIGILSGILVMVFLSVFGTINGFLRLIVLQIICWLLYLILINRLW